MDTFNTIGKFAFALPLLVFGVMHLMKGKEMEGIVPGFLPGKLFWVYLVGAALLAGSLSIMTGFLARWATLGLVLMFLSFILTVHLPGMMTAKDPGMKKMAMMGLLKDISLCGAALYMAGFYWGAM
jgi:putative oxidoreductase